jgi:hypothetical protein
MSIQDFVKKHKGKLAATAGTLGTIAAIALANKSEKRAKTRRLLEYVANNPREYGYEYKDDPIVEDVGLGKSGGRRRTNLLLKAVQAYKKKHGCSLKEAWAAVRQ